MVIEVSDTGPGLSEKARAHLFEAFQGSTRTGSVGLGLAIVAELVRAHGGEVRLVEGTIGATFRCHDPRPRGRSRHPPRRARERVRGERVGACAAAVLRIEHSFVIAGLDPAIHLLGKEVMRSAMDHPRVTGRMNGAPNLPLPAEAYS